MRVRAPLCAQLYACMYFVFLPYVRGHYEHRVYTAVKWTRVRACALSNRHIA